MNVRRYKPSELGTLDLTLHDPRIAWATRARASSEWSSSYAASSACGPPSVFPKGGDEYGTWLAESGDRTPHLELTFSASFAPRALIVCETCGPGGISAIRDLDGDRVLYAAKATKLEPSREALLLVVPLDGEAPAPRRVRIELKNVGGDYQEIDAAGLLAVPIEELIASPPSAGAVRHRRYEPDEVAALRLRDDHRIVWAKRAKASSEWSESYGAKHATGAPNVFPKAGDHERTWLSENEDRDAWIELEFDNDQPVHGFLVAETCGAGATVRAEDGEGRVLWQSRPEKLSSSQARMLHVAIEGEPILKKLRLHVSPSVTEYREIDAVALVTAPFEELSAPPPPPPVPGAPRGGFTQLSGVLSGVGPDRPAAHVVVATEKDARVVSWAGPLTLVVEGGHEVALTLEEATVYGPPLRRRRGAYREVAAHLPWLAEALGADAPAPDEEVEVSGRAIAAGGPVHVAGIASGRADAGFREAAGAPERLSVRAIAEVPLGQTDFLREGTKTFQKGARRLVRSRAAPHPYDRWMQVLGGISLAGLLTAGGLSSSLAAGLTASGWAVSLAAFGLSLGLFTLSATLELALRRAAPLVIERGGKSQRNARIRLPRPLWSLLAAALVLGVFLCMFSVAVADVSDPLTAIFTVAPVFGGAYALVRLPMWAWSSLPALIAATRATLGGAVEGLLEDDVSVEESHTEHSEHLGTEQVVDSQGRVTTRDRYRTWTTRDLRVSGHPSLVRGDGEVVRLSPAQLIVPAPEPRPVQGAVVASLGASFGAGDPVLASGAPDRGGRLRGAVVLGERGPLRRAVVLSWAALGALLLVAAGVLPFAITLAQAALEG